MRAPALAAGALHVVLCAIAAFLMFFVATFPFENQSTERAAADDWLIGAATLILILAFVIIGAVIARRAALAAVALVAEFAVATLIVAYALRQSDHSDGKLVLYAMAVAVTTVATVTAAYVEQR